MEQDLYAALNAALGDLPNGFSELEEAAEGLRAACDASEGRVTRYAIGSSEAGRPIDGFVAGTGAITIGLLAGAHADEPVGPETLRRLIPVLGGGAFDALLERFRFVILPHINPDGEAANRAWIEAWPDPSAYIRLVRREKPGRDIEFGYPSMRAENEAVSSFLGGFAPFSLYVNLHGMAFSEGAMLLIERHWAGRTQSLRDGFASAAREEGLPLHDHNRKGDKGFFYIEKGFTTTPEGDAMQRHFLAEGDEATAAGFHLSSMEWVRALGGDPLCLVTEMPLFQLPSSGTGGVPSNYLAFRAGLPRLKERLERGEAAVAFFQKVGLQPVPVQHAVRLQLAAIAQGLAAAERRGTL